jgi:hypothetical protein
MSHILWMDRVTLVLFLLLVVVPAGWYRTMVPRRCGGGLLLAGLWLACGFVASSNGSIAEKATSR